MKFVVFLHDVCKWMRDPGDPSKLAVFASYDAAEEAGLAYSRRASVLTLA